jgi:two-component system, chemotaxis family, protein-glutamate methylesterase/glutaminase
MRPELGHIYVAPPDRHLLLVGRRVRVTGGPRENGHRPAIDPLFRSAARSYGPGCWRSCCRATSTTERRAPAWSKDRGGMVVVQDPADALYPDMPSSAAAMVDVDALVPAREIPDLLCRLLEKPVETGAGHGDAAESDEDEELAAAELALDGQPTKLSCPECGGPLWERSAGPLIRFACRVGHIFSPESLLAQHGQGLERALWSAQRSLEERADLYRRMARRARDRPLLERRFLDRSASAEEHAAAVQGAIAKLTGSGELEEP